MIKLKFLINKFFKKAYLFFSLLNFLRRYPYVSMYGAPSFLRYISSRFKSLPSGIYSQSGQDALILTEFFERISGPGFPKIFVDVGCNHPVKHSNSYFFERFMNFQVLAIDALPNHQGSWASIRPAAEFLVAAVGKTRAIIEFDEIEDSGGSGDMFSSVKGSSMKSPNLERKTRSIEIVPLSEILSEKDLNSVGIMSIDIEGHEAEALQGINLDEVNVKIFIIENNTKSVLGDETIRQHLRQRGYKFVARIWDMDDIFLFED